MSQQSSTPNTNTETSVNWEGVTEARHIKAWFEDVPDEALIGVRYSQGEMHTGVQNTIHATWDRLRAEIFGAPSPEGSPEPASEGNSN